VFMDDLECRDFDILVLLFNAFNLFKGILLFTSWDPTVTD
jgi:hypothetical protein